MINVVLIWQNNLNRNISCYGVYLYLLKIYTIAQFESKASVQSSIRETFFIRETIFIVSQFDRETCCLWFAVGSTQVLNILW